jgi:hypothetical protein
MVFKLKRFSLNIVFVTTWGIMFAITWFIWITIVYKILKEFL